MSLLRSHPPPKKPLKVGGSKTGKSAPAKDPVEEPTDKVIMDEQPTEDIPISDEGYVSDPEDTDNAHMPKILDTTTWFRLIPEEERPASPKPEWIEDIGSFIRWYYRRIGKEDLSKADLEGPAFMMVKGFHENIISLQFQMEECHKLLTNQIDLVNPDISNPLPLGGPPGQVTIQLQFFFNKDLEYLLTGDKERNRALSISKLKATLYQEFGLEELVPSLWIESKRDNYVSNCLWYHTLVVSRKQFYINKHSEPSDGDAVRSHMRILSVISVKTYERYGYNYLREIVLRRADYNEYKISEKDFKSLHLNDFEDLNILHIQGKLYHLPKQDKVHLHNAASLWTRNIVIRKRVEDLQLGIKSYQTKLNLEQPNWDASDFPFKEDYIIVFKPKAVIYRDRDDNRKMMRINEVHKFSDGTLTTIKEKMDFMVKDFKLFKFNKGMENRKWTKDDKRRSEDFIEVIERRLKIRRIFRSLESFVGGRLRDIDYRLISRTEGELYQKTDHAFYFIGDIRLVRLEHPSETKVFHNEDGNPARANIKQALGRLCDSTRIKLVSTGKKRNSKHKEKGENGPEWVVKSKFEDELANFMLEKKSHAKGIGDMLHKEKLEKAAASVKLSEECSAVIQRSLPRKKEIQEASHCHVLLDLWQLILKIDEDKLVPIILRRPFLATTRAIIDVHEGKLSLRVGSETVTFNIGKSMKSKHSCNDYLYYAHHTAKLVQEQWVDTVNHDEEWTEEEEGDDLNKIGILQAGGELWKIRSKISKDEDSA
ncbi:hypothetical protein Tco_0078803 [Tanacetum coccineum]